MNTGFSHGWIDAGGEIQRSPAIIIAMPDYRINQVNRPVLLVYTGDFFVPNMESGEDVKDQSKKG